MSLEDHRALKDDAVHEYWLAAISLWNRIMEREQTMASGSSRAVTAAVRAEAEAWDLLEVRLLDIIYKYDGYPEGKDFRRTLALSLIAGVFGTWCAVLAFKEWSLRRIWEAQREE